MYVALRGKDPCRELIVFDWRGGLSDAIPFGPRYYKQCVCRTSKSTLRILPESGCSIDFWKNHADFRCAFAFGRWKTKAQRTRVNARRDDFCSIERKMQIWSECTSFLILGTTRAENSFQTKLQRTEILKDLRKNRICSSLKLWRVLSLQKMLPQIKGKNVLVIWRTNEVREIPEIISTTNEHFCVSCHRCEIVLEKFQPIYLKARKFFFNIPSSDVSSFLLMEPGDQASSSQENIAIRK